MRPLNIIFSFPFHTTGIRYLFSSSPSLPDWCCWSPSALPIHGTTAYVCTISSALCQVLAAINKPSLLFFFALQDSVGQVKKLSALVNGKLGLRCWLVILGILLLVGAHLSGQVRVGFFFLGPPFALDYIVDVARSLLKLVVLKCLEWSTGFQSDVPVSQRSVARLDQRGHGASFGQLFQRYIPAPPFGRLHLSAVASLPTHAGTPLLVPQVFICTNFQLGSSDCLSLGASSGAGQ